MWCGVVSYGIGCDVVWYEVVTWCELCGLQSRCTDHVATKTQLFLFSLLLLYSSLFSRHPLYLQQLSLPLVLSVQRNVTDMTEASYFRQRNLRERAYAFVAVGDVSLVKLIDLTDDKMKSKIA